MVNSRQQSNNSRIEALRQKFISRLEARRREEEIRSLVLGLPSEHMERLVHNLQEAG